MNKWESISNFIEVGRKPEMSVQALGSVVLLKDLLSCEVGHLSECHEEGSLKEDNNVKEQLNNLGGRLLHKYIANEYISCIWIWDHGIVEMEATGKSYIRVTGLSQNEEFIINLRSIIVSQIKDTVEQGHIYAIIKQGNHLSLHSIGNAGIPIIPGNYTPTVMENYKYVVQDLNSVHPSGRIIILEGEPGTGKTHLVRSWLLEVPDAMFVLVSPDMVSSLGGPELLPLLLTHKSSTMGPIILVLEDADKCLVTRQGDNINSIQALLNLGDGILGSLLDLRIIATTNAKKLEMESAILRPGRLSKRLEVNSLDKETAQLAFKRLLPNKDIPSKLKSSLAMTLAEVYALARENGWTPETRIKDNGSENLLDKSVYDDDDDD